MKDLTALHVLGIMASAYILVIIALAVLMGISYLCYIIFHKPRKYGR